MLLITLFFYSFYVFHFKICFIHFFFITHSWHWGEVVQLIGGLHLPSHSHWTCDYGLLWERISFVIFTLNFYWERKSWIPYFEQALFQAYPNEGCEIFYKFLHMKDQKNNVRCQFKTINESVLHLSCSSRIWAPRVSCLHLKLVHPQLFISQLFNSI